MCLIDLKDDKNFTLQNRSVGHEESKAGALSVVPNFSLSPPPLAFLMWGGTNVLSHAFAFCSLYYP